MQLDGRRTSSNVEDRRSISGGAAAGIGLGGMALIAIISLLMGGNPGDVLQQMQQAGYTTQTTQTTKEYSAEEQELYDFSTKILASTEDVWTKIFAAYGKTYTPPTMVVYSGSVQTACGAASSSVGPFYCSGDQCLYIDLDFFKTMKQSIGADGDFAYAYVIAHEVGHHVQNLLGTLNSAHQAMSRMNTANSNAVSVRLELQADFYAGIWGHYESKLFGSLEQGDIEEALVAASKIGDDYLQKKSYGTTRPESYTHGTSAQREKWLRLGLSTGDMSKGDTFSARSLD